MAITSTTQLANLALSEIGARRIDALDSDTTTEAKSCNLHFDHCRDSLLRRHQWSFATTRTGLSKLTDVPIKEWGAAWQLPPDCVRLIRVVSAANDAAIPANEFTIEGRHLLTADDTAKTIVYVSNAVEVGQWDSLFIEAMTYALAARIANDVTQNPGAAQAATQKLEALALPTAQTADAREVMSGENFGPAHLAARSGLVQARYRQNGAPSYRPTLPTS
jgi:hypothetical protein